MLKRYHTIAVFRSWRLQQVIRKQPVGRGHSKYHEDLSVWEYQIWHRQYLPEEFHGKHKAGKAKLALSSENFPDQHEEWGFRVSSNPTYLPILLMLHFSLYATRLPLRILRAIVVCMVEVPQVVIHKWIAQFISKLPAVHSTWRTACRISPTAKSFTVPHSGMLFHLLQKGF